MNTTLKNKKICVFDSGAGGLSIAKELLQRDYQFDLIYIADQHYFPYGELDDKVLETRVLCCIERCVREHTPDLIIIACNTASTLVLPSLRKRWPQLPFIGVVPAIKPAAIASKTKKIIVLATPATINRAYMDQLISDHAQQIQVYRMASKKLVQLAEELLKYGTLNKAAFTQELKEVCKECPDADQMVLACTHFPLLKEEIDHAIDTEKLSLVDSSQAIADRAQYLLPEINKKPRTFLREACVINTGHSALNHYMNFLRKNSLQKIHMHSTYWQDK